MPNTATLLNQVVDVSHLAPEARQSGLHLDESLCVIVLFPFPPTVKSADSPSCPANIANNVVHAGFVKRCNRRVADASRSVKLQPYVTTGR